MTGSFRVVLLGLATGAAVLPITNANAQQVGSTAPGLEEGTELETTDIVVTATRNEQSLSKVPISVAAFSQVELDKQGVRRVDDLVRYTPGLTLTRTDRGSNDIAIRGISSSAGAGTTGIYIDDTPIQVRNLGFGSGSTFPEIFDLQRVEVLRGPQGTLFGAGSEGGTIRFIQTPPSMKDTSIYARAQVSETEHGAPSYESGVAFGAPIITDKIGFRASIYYRRDGGYVDAETGILAPAQGASPGSRPTPVYPFANLATYTKTGTVRDDANWRTALTGRLAVEFRPTETLTITPSVSYQRTRNGQPSDSFLFVASDLGRHDFTSVNFVPGNANTNPALTPIQAPTLGNGQDRFILSAVAAQLELGTVNLFSNTSYFDRNYYQNADYTRFDGIALAQLVVPPEGGKSNSLFTLRQKNFTQEFRVQSADQTGLFSFTAGVFYTYMKQLSEQYVSNNFFYNLPFFLGAVTDGDPYGPGHTAFVNFFGYELLPNSNYYGEQRFANETQLAGFAQFDLRPLPGLTLTAGVRVTRNRFEFTGLFTGANNNLNAPAGSPCPLGAGQCAVGQPPFEPQFGNTIGNVTKETNVTPKFGVSYQLNRDHLFYASVSKGYRPAGATSQNPSFCAQDLANFGYQKQPLTYASDTVWSYELGAKSRLMGGKVSLDGSVYRVDWKNIQTQVFQPLCQYDFIDNFGEARSEGFDLSFDVRPTRGLTVGGSVGYNSAKFTAAGLSPLGRVIFQKGSSVPGSPSPWIIYLNGQYDFEAFNQRKFYVRADYTFTAKARRSGNQVPGAPNYNPLLLPNPSYDLLALRAGMRLGDADLSLFVQNVFDSRPILGLAPQALGSDYVYGGSTVRPRTIGLTLSYRR